ncbi:MAG: potC [Verrucomicrobiales bacterium]|nr:potC [Verrucomicrobiales bacterium]
MNNRSSLFTRAAALLLVLFLYAPLIIVIKNSFNEAPFGLEWKGFTLKWYVKLWNDDLARSALKNSALLAIVSTTVSTILGTLLALGWSRASARWSKWISGLLYIPVCVPDIVMGVSLLLFYSMVRQWLGIFQLGLLTMILAHVTFQLPFVALVVRARLTGTDPAIVEAAEDLGANPWQRFLYVTFPLAVPGIAAGALLAFTLSLDDFVVSFFTSGPGSTTLPILIYSSIKRGLSPEINALSTLLIAASVIGTVFMALLEGEKLVKNSTPV